MDAAHYAESELARATQMVRDADQRMAAAAAAEQSNGAAVTAAKDMKERAADELRAASEVSLEFFLWF